jgi:hypothetical protein
MLVCALGKSVSLGHRCECGAPVLVVLVCVGVFCQQYEKKEMKIHSQESYICCSFASLTIVERKGKYCELAIVEGE